MLAVLLQDHVAALVHPDQTGFIVGHETRDDTFWALHFLHGAQKGPARVPCLVLSMDAEKAFDPIKWVYMAELLHGLGLDLVDFGTLPESPSLCKGERNPL